MFDETENNPDSCELSSVTPQVNPVNPLAGKIPAEMRILGGKMQPTARLRDLYDVLGGYANFSARSKEHFDSVKAVEGHDFELTTPRVVNAEPGRGRPATDFIVTLRVARKIVMLSKSDLADAVRDYFCDVEDAFIEQQRNAAPAHRLPGSFTEALRMLLESEEAKEQANTARLIAEEKTEQAQLLLERREIENDQLAASVKTMAPKVQYVDNVLSARNGFPIKIIAADMGVGAVNLNRWLQALKIQHKVGGCWILNANYAGKGYTDIKTYDFKDPVTNEARTSHSMVWTELGRKFIMGLDFSAFKNKKG